MYLSAIYLNISVKNIKLCIQNSILMLLSMRWHNGKESACQCKRHRFYLWEGKIPWSCCSLSCVQLFETPWIAACQASLSFTISQCFLKLMSIESVIRSYHLVLGCPLLLLPLILPSIRILFNDSVLRIK